MAINYDKLISDLSRSRDSIINKLEKRKNDVDRYFYCTNDKQEFYHNFIMNVVDKYLGDARSQL